MLTGTNFKILKETVEIVLGCMDLDLTFRSDRPITTEAEPNEAKIEKLDRSNRMCMMIMKRSIPDAFRGSVAESKTTKSFHEAVEKYFARNEKTEASSLLATLASMRYKEEKRVQRDKSENVHLPLYAHGKKKKGPKNKWNQNVSSARSRGI
ncbi:uncharacterized protein LOC127242567 [Andrographis paniculata]|uniref:uncharacterized protein LOC127242567 n=1 Tax=Andrographis paniculata TaxID=175694 RepID=UPI0021E9335E|nr:uncharacterized protein LOC127242567 [Andrographis paniculata]